MLAIAEQNLIGSVLFYAFAVIAGGSALGVVLSRNIVRMAVFLLFTLVGVAGLYFLLDAEFLAAVQLVVYAGGTLILIVFGVMLTSKSPFSRFEPKLGEIAVGISFASVALITLILGIMNLPLKTTPAGIGGTYPMDKLGQALLGDYLIPFELASVLLLVVMIGSAYLAKGRKHEPEVRPNELSKKARMWS